MKIIYTKSYDNTLKKYPKEKEELQEVIDLIENSTDLYELENNPIANLYDFERLKYNLNKFYSFRLNDNKIRLIILPDNNSIIFVYISYKHYSDFDERKVIYYDEWIW